MTNRSLVKTYIILAKRYMIDKNDTLSFMLKHICIDKCTECYLRHTIDNCCLIFKIAGYDMTKY